MRAFVLLCLLHTAFSNFPWNPSPDSEATDSNNEHVCTITSGSCGCCEMLLRVEDLRTYFNKSLSDLERKYLQTNKSLIKTKDSRSAFSAALQNKHLCFGPYIVDRIIPYEHVFLNLGNDYNVNTGVFTARHAGVYSLALTVYSDAGSSTAMLAACVSLMLNNMVLARSTDINRNDQEDSATIVLIIKMKIGDTLSVRLPVGCFLCDDSSHYNTFSAFLLHPV